MISSNGETFQKTDKEAAYDNDIHLVHLRTDKAEDHLQQEVDQQDRLVVTTGRISGSVDKQPPFPPMSHSKPC